MAKTLRVLFLFAIRESSAAALGPHDKIFERRHHNFEAFPGRDAKHAVQKRQLIAYGSAVHRLFGASSLSANHRLAAAMLCLPA
jgi:hypothetical protein